LTLLIALVSFILFTNCDKQTTQFTEEDKSQIKTEVQKSFETLVLATKKSDWEGYFNLFDHENFSGLNADGTTWESFNEFKDSVLPAFKMIEKNQALKFPILKITVIDSQTAVLINEYEQQLLLTNGQSIEVSGGGTQVWSKASGTWKLVSVSASSKS
tara:strand:+ start:64021 stop:64494 length:474 start_codon:yes stop_codon:yes gene_type:complete